jgi:hypothetical protein
MNHGLYQYDIEIRDDKSLSPQDNAGVLSSGCHVIIYDAGTMTKSTIYADENKTAKTNDITRTQFATDTRIKFWSASATHDIAISDDKGNNVKHLSVAPTTHVLPINRSRSAKCLVFPMVFNAGGTVVDTGLDLPYGSVVTDVAVEVVTTDAGETVDIGLLASETAGDEDGFCAGVSVATAGVPALHTYTVGSNETYLSACTYGVLLASRSVGSDLATDIGSLAKLKHYVTGSNATSITYTPSSSDTFAGYGYVFFDVLR